MGRVHGEQMVKDAEANAEADSKRRQTIEAKNEMDSLIYGTEKNLTDNGDKLDDETKAEVNKAIEEAKAVKDSEELEEIKEKSEALSKAAMKIGQAMYGKQEGGQDAEGASEEEKKDDSTVDADFKEKTDESEKK